MTSYFSETCDDTTKLWGFLTYLMMLPLTASLKLRLYKSMKIYRITGNMKPEAITKENIRQTRSEQTIKRPNTLTASR
jgi:hypothetical protein